MLTFAVRFDMPVRELAVDFVSPTELRVDFSMSPVVLAVDFKGLLFRDKPVYVEPELYKGDYEVEPSFDRQQLPTKAKKMTDDLTVEAIEVQRVSNAAGGRVHEDKRSVGQADRYGGVEK